MEIMPDDLESYLASYEQQWKSAFDLFYFSDSQRHHPVKEFEKHWIKQSMMRAAELFLERETLEIGNASEDDILHSVWRFAYKAFEKGEVSALLGGRYSVAVAIARNEDRSLEAVERRTRKNMGAKLDILFKAGNHELGSCEAGKDNVASIDDKYLDDGLMKLPKTRRDMLSQLAYKNPEKINSLTTVGILLMGLDMEVLIMNVPVGHTITRISKTNKLSFPVLRQDIATDLIPLLEMVWKTKKLMEHTLSVLSDRKRKATEIALPGNGSNKPLLSFSFVRNK